MRISVLIAIFLIIMVPKAVEGQNRSMVVGTILDGESGSPLEYATISLIRASDSSLVTGGVSNNEGRFALPVEPGYYIAKVQFVTYESLVVPDVQVNPNKATPLGDLRLHPNSEELDEVVVQAQKTQMELTLDKKIYNVGQDLSNLGGSASDILENLPSVTVDVEGNVELRGSSNVKILIDGKPSGLVGLSSTDALRQLQGNMVESVEIITNPSARYDAEGMAGIINIILKKENRNGVNGSFQVNTGYPHNHGVSANVNFRRDWVNFFVNYGLSYRNAPGLGNAYQEYHLNSPAATTGVSDYYTQMKRNHNRGGVNNSVRFGADFFLNKSTTITGAFLYRYGDELNVSTLRFYDYDFYDQLLSYTEREDEETEGDENLEYSVNFTKEFKRKEHKLTADIQYQNNAELEESDIEQFSGPSISEIDSLLFQDVRNDEGEERWMIQSDYIQPFGLGGKFEAGFRSTIRNVKNIYDVGQKSNENDNYEPLEEYSTDFAYNERVHAAYSIVSHEGDKFSWQGGLRAEMTDINSLQKEDTTRRAWKYTNFFPSVFLTYKIKEESQLQLSYSRRINRPRFRELNPFSSFTDNRNLRIGNPDLQPEFTDSYEFGFLQNLPKSSIYYGVYYRYTQDLINRVSLEPNEAGQRIRQPYNIGESHDIGIESNVAHEFTDWYRISGNFNFYRGETIGSVGDSISLNAKTVTFNTRVSNNFKFQNLFDAQVNISYRAPENRPQGKRYSMTEVDLGLSRDVLNKNGTIAVSVNDLFNSRKYRFVNESDTFYERGTWQWRKGPQVQMTFTYRLNQKKQRPEKGDGNFGGDDF